MSDAGVILLVEDDSADVLLLRRAFMKGGITHPLRVAPDGAEAIAYVAGSGGYADRAQHPRPSIVLLDIKLPSMSGFDVLSWIRQDPASSRLPVIMLSSSTHPADISRAYDAGANGYHGKPSDAEGFTALVDKMRLYWLPWTDRADGMNRPPDVIFPSISGLTDVVASAKSKVHVLLTRAPAGLTPEEIAQALVAHGLAVGSLEVVIERIRILLTDLERGSLHRRVVRTEDGRYHAVPFW